MWFTLPRPKITALFSGMLVVAFIGCSRETGPSAAQSAKSPSVSPEAIRYEALPGSSKLKQLDLTDGMLVEFTTDIELVKPASEKAKLEGFAPAPNTLYFAEARVFQSEDRVGPFGMIDLETKAPELKIGEKFWSPSELKERVDHCEFNFLNKLGMMKVEKGLRLRMRASMSFVSGDSMVIPLFRADVPKDPRCIAQLQCFFPTHAGEKSPLIVDDFLNITGHRFQVLVQKKN